MLFSLPRLRTLVFLITVALVIAFYVRCSLIYLVHTTLVLSLLLKLSAPRLITVKRALGLTPFFIAWCALITFMRGYSPLFLTPPSLLLSTVTRFISNRRSWSLMILATTLAAIFLDGGGVTAVTVHLTLSSLAIVLTELYIHKLDNELRVFGGIEVLTAYLNYALVGVREQLASLLARISVNRSVPVYALDLLDGEEIWGTVVIPHVHPGPFRNFGSSSLPQKFVEEASRRGLFCMVLHGASAHSEDLAREEETETLVKQVLTGSGETLCTGSSLGIAERSNGVHRAVALALEGGWSLTVIERIDGGMEDIPLSFTEALGPYAILVDAHNSYESPRPSPTLGDPLGTSLIHCASSAMSAARKHVVDGWRIAVAQKVGKFDSELGSAGVAMLQLSHESGLKLLLISFDANNMVRAVRDAIYSMIGGHSAIVIAATTDTHELTGVRPGSTYEPLGAKQNAEAYAHLVRDLVECSGTPKALRYRLRKLNFSSLYLDLEKLQRLSKTVDTMLTKALAIYAFCFITFFIPLLIH